MTDLSLLILLQAQDMASQVINNLGISLDKVGLLAGGAAVALGVTAVSAAGDFQQAMLNLESHAGLAASQVDTVNKALMQMGPAVGKGPTELATALYPVLSGLSSMTDQSAKTQVALVELNDAAKSVAGTQTDTTTVTNAATSAFNAFGLQTNDTATNISRMNTLFDVMNATVTAGNMQWSNYANKIGDLSAKAAQSHVSFTEANSALAVFTNTGESVDLAGTHLGALFLKMGDDADTLAKHAEKLHLTFDETKFKSLDLAGKIKYLDDITGNDPGKIKAILGNQTLAVTFQKLSDHASDYTSALDSLSHSQGATTTAFETASSGFNFAMQKLMASGQALLITIGSGLLPLLTEFANRAIIPLIGYIADFSHHTDVLIPILSGIGAVLLAVVIPAVGSLAVEVAVATWPFLLLGAAIAGIVWLFMHFYQTSAPFKSFIDTIVSGLMYAWNVISSNFIPVMIKIGEAIQKYVFPFLVQIGQYIAQQFTPLWKQLVDLWQSQLMPIVKMVMDHLDMLKPVLETIGVIIGVYLVVNIAFLIGMITGLARGLATFLGGAITFISGFVQFFTGVMQVFSGLIKLAADLATGHFNKLGIDLGLIWAGIQNMFAGTWKAIIGLFQMSLGTIIAYIQGFADGVIKFFVILYNDLVGHSIIPDMITGIINWFAQLLIMPLRYIDNMTSSIIDKFNAFLIICINFGYNIVNNIASGITNSIGGTLNSAMNNVTQFIADHLPHSPAKLGPLKDLVLQGSLITEQIGQGMVSRAPILSQSMSTIMQPISSPFGGNSSQAGGMSITINIDGRSARTDQDLVNMLMDKLSRELNRSGSIAPWISGGRA